MLTESGAKKYWVIQALTMRRFAIALDRDWIHVPARESIACRDRRKRFGGGVWATAMCPPSHPDAQNAETLSANCAGRRDPN